MPVSPRSCDYMPVQQGAVEWDPEFEQGSCGDAREWPGAGRRLSDLSAVSGRRLKLVSVLSVLASALVLSVASLRRTHADVQQLISQSEAASCMRYGCHESYREWQDCQCNADCSKHNNCCDDYDGECSKAAKNAAMADLFGVAKGSCATYGCGGHYSPENTCQCNDECKEKGSCCADFDKTCEGPSPPKTSSHHASRTTSPKPATMAPVPGTATATAAAGKSRDGEPLTFYVYRAQGGAGYPPENVNVADLAGVLWYLHREVVPATPRKYHIDRIKRFKISMLPTKEFWNVHHAMFGPFFSYDGGRCSNHQCGQTYHQYGFIVGCQLVDTNLAAYYAESQTTWTCEKGTDACRPPVWYSLPGECPEMGLTNNHIAGNKASLDVMSAKTPECVKRSPGGHCAKATGAPDCTYSIEDAGEIMLDELAGIPDYHEFWYGSFHKCEEQQAQGAFTGNCIPNKEYVGKTDKGVGCNFWNGRNDPHQCAARVQAAQALFKAKFPADPDLPEPVCDFDTFYKDEFTWPVNHTGALHSDWWENRMPVTVDEKMRARRL
mmetsp:Transcript_66668/g.171637  ORF Transcript_66668/g.171637 Transcript_66668/m.171637 type:complete len:551 (+) Transcript_66668:54-1706(+)